MIPFPNADTRAEARDNAISLAKEAEDALKRGGANPDGLTSLALVWSRIAETFPHEEVPASDQTQVIKVAEDHHPYPAQQPIRAIVSGSGVTMDGGMPIRVHSHGWDALRVLAIRYLAALHEHRTTVDLAQLEETSGWELSFVQMPGETTVHILLDHEA